MPEFEGKHPAGRGLRPAPRAAAGLRRRRLAQQPDLPAGGLGHLGHEGGDERRAQPVGARRLVGRGLRRRATAGRSSRPPTALDERARNREEARTLYEMLQDHVIPLYYERDGRCGYSPGWVRDGEALDVADLLPRFNSAPHARRVRRQVLRAGGAAGPALRREPVAPVARDVAAWKARVRAAWPGVRCAALDAPVARIAVRRDGARRSGGEAERPESRRRGGGAHAEPVARRATSRWQHAQPRARKAPITDGERALRAGACAGAVRQAGLPHPRLPAP